MVETEGLVLLGPGSEWFWSLVSNVILVVTLVGLYVQVRAQHAASILEQFNSVAAQWDTKEFRYQRLHALIDLEHRPVEDGMPPSAMLVAGWFDGIGGLVRKRHVHADDVAAGYAENVLSWWAVTRPYIEHDRARFSAPAHLGDFEDLARRMNATWVRDFARPYEPMESMGERIDRLTLTLTRQRDAERGIIPERRPAARA